MGALLGSQKGASGGPAPQAMIIDWSPRAIDDLAALRDYISEDNPTAAERLALRIIHNVEDLLSGNPDIGRPGRVPGTRELVVPRTPYIVPYRVRHNRIEVLRVYHGARRWPERFLMHRAQYRSVLRQVDDCGEMR
jgi:toxin ParE1/3/4